MNIITIILKVKFSGRDNSSLVLPICCKIQRSVLEAFDQHFESTVLSEPESG